MELALTPALVTGVEDVVIWPGLRLSAGVAF
jgi:hypothetical protein